MTAFEWFAYLGVPVILTLVGGAMAAAQNRASRREYARLSRGAGTSVKNDEAFEAPNTASPKANA